MIRYMTIGHFDHDALQNHRLVVVKPLDMKIVHQLVAEMGEFLPNGEMVVAALPVIYQNGYIMCPPIVRGKALEFLVRLAEETSCDIADMELGHLMTPKEFREHCERLVDVRNQAPPLFPPSSTPDRSSFS